MKSGFRANRDASAGINCQRSGVHRGGLADAHRSAWTTHELVRAIAADFRLLKLKTFFEKKTRSGMQILMRSAANRQRLPKAIQLNRQPFAKNRIQTRAIHCRNESVPYSNDFPPSGIDRCRLALFKSFPSAMGGIQ